MSFRIVSDHFGLFRMLLLTAAARAEMAGRTLHEIEQKLRGRGQRDVRPGCDDDGRRGELFLDLDRR
jgi:hypothetical protein